MADGSLKLDLDAGVHERLRAAAGAVGRSIEDYAANLIAQGLDDDWAEDYARAAEYERTGEYIDAETAMREFREKLEQRLSEKRK